MSKRSLNPSFSLSSGAKQRNRDETCLEIEVLNKEIDMKFFEGHLTFILEAMTKSILLLLRAITTLESRVTKLRNKTLKTYNTLTKNLRF